MLLSPYLFLNLVYHQNLLELKKNKTKLPGLFTGDWDSTGLGHVLGGRNIYIYIYVDIFVYIYMYIYLINKIYILERFRFTAKLSRKYRVPIYPPHTTSPLSISLTSVLRLSLSMSLHWHLIITQSPQLTLGLTLGVVHSPNLDKCIMTGIHHYNIIQGGVYLSPKFSVLCLFIPLSLQPLATTNIFINSTALHFP